MDNYYSHSGNKMKLIPYQKEKNEKENWNFGKGEGGSRTSGACPLGSACLRHKNKQ